MLIYTSLYTAQSNLVLVLKSDFVKGKPDKVPGKPGILFGTSQHYNAYTYVYDMYI